jgi:hypothetical protein
MNQRRFFQCAAVVCWWLVLAPSMAKAEETVSALLKDYDSANRAKRAYIEMLVSRTLDGMNWANAYLQSDRKEQRLFCHPDNLDITGGKMIDMLRRETRRSPEMAALPYGYGILATNVRVFPCPNS